MGSQETATQTPVGLGRKLGILVARREKTDTHDIAAIKRMGPAVVGEMEQAKWEAQQRELIHKNLNNSPYAQYGKLFDLLENTDVVIPITMKDLLVARITDIASTYGLIKEVTEKNTLIHTSNIQGTPLSVDGLSRLLNTTIKDLQLEFANSPLIIEAFRNKPHSYFTDALRDLSEVKDFHFQKLIDQTSTLIFDAAMDNLTAQDKSALNQSDEHFNKLSTIQKNLSLLSKEYFTPAVNEKIAAANLDKAAVRKELNDSAKEVIDLVEKMYGLPDEAAIKGKDQALSKLAEIKRLIAEATEKVSKAQGTSEAVDVKTSKETST